MRILLLDNYDSFTFNLVHILRELNIYFDVFKTDEMNIPDIENYDKIIISPGPGLPKESINLYAILDLYHDIKPILGICLGHQAIAEYFGGTLKRLPFVKHGISSVLNLKNTGHMFDGLEGKIEVGRYHSWLVSEDDFPNELKITSQDEVGHIMSFEHEYLPVYGVQFHPESIMTPRGKEMMGNFLFNK